jgi:PAS domain S-box-containing protein
MSLSWPKLSGEPRTESEERYRLLLDNLGEGVAYVDPHEIFTFGNPAADSIFGVGPGELVGKCLLDFLSSDVRMLIRKEAALRRSDVKSRYEHEIVRPNGKRRNLEVTATPQFHPDGRFLGTFAVFWDITDRKRAEQALHETTEQHKRTSRMMELALEMGKAGAWLVDLETSEVTWNETYVRLLGVDTVHTLEGFFELVHPDDRKVIRAHIQESVRNPGGPFQNRFRVVLPKGVRWMERRGQVLCDSSGKAVQMIGVTADVTEQKLAEDELRKSEERYRTILQTALDGFCVVDTRGRLVEVNESFCRMCGYSRDELLAMRLCDLVANETIDETEVRIKRVVSQGYDRFEFMLHRKDGSIFDAEVSIQYRATDGGRLVAFLHDITERKRADERSNRYLRDLEAARERQEKNNAELERMVEQLAMEKDRAEAATRSKSEFLSSMSHEIRTPMCGVLGMTGLLLDTQLTPEQRTYAEIVRSSGQALLDIINDILDFSKVEAGKLDLEIVPFDLHGVLVDVLELLGPKAQEKTLELSLRYDRDSLREFLGDPGRIRQVVLNLVGNAIKFTEWGSVRVEVDSRAITDRSAFVRIAVCDTGIGIAPAALGMLFEKFRQLDPSSTRKHGGTGLGLAISKQLVELMGGTLTVTSEPGEGSTFTMELPLRTNPLPRTAPNAAKREATGKPVFAGTRILLVEDNIVNQKVGAAQLGKLGCRVDVAANGLEALKMTAQLPYDLIFMDCQMPEMDGYETTGHIRKREGADRHTPIIALTAGAMAKDRERCVQAGMDDYLSKPFRPAQLEELLVTYLGPRPSASAGDQTSREAWQGSNGKQNS